MSVKGQRTQSNYWTKRWRRKVGTSKVRSFGYLGDRRDIYEVSVLRSRQGLAADYEDFDEKSLLAWFQTKPYYEIVDYVYSVETGLWDPMVDGIYSDLGQAEDVCSRLNEETFDHWLVVRIPVYRRA